MDGEKPTQGVPSNVEAGESIRKLSPNQHARKARGKTLDKISLILFCIVQVIYFAFAGYAILEMVTNWDKETEFTGALDGAVSGNSVNIQTGANAPAPSTGAFNNQTRWMFIYSTVVALGVNAILIITMPFLAKFYVWLGPVFFVIYLIAAAVLAAHVKKYVGTVISSLFIVVIIFGFIMMRKRYKLATYCLQTAGDTAKKHPSVFMLTLTGLLVQGGLSILNINAIFAIFLRFEPDHQECKQGVFCSWWITYAGVAYAMLSHLWASSIVSNILLTALAGGPFSAYYFKDPKRELGSFYALRQVLRKSVGSICFGSIFVAGVHFIHSIVSGMAGGNVGGNVGGDVGGDVVQCGFCGLGYLVSFLDKMVKLFNKYVYIFIAIGKTNHKEPEKSIERFEETFWEAGLHCADFVIRGPRKHARKNPGLIKQIAKSHGIAILIDDNITGSALFMACLSTAVLCVAFVIAYMFIINGDAVPDHGYDWAIIIYTFFLGLIIGLVFTSTLEVGVSTLFVCMSEDITLLAKVNPKFYEFIKREYSDMFNFLPE